MDDLDKEYSDIKTKKQKLQEVKEKYKAKHQESLEATEGIKEKMKTPLEKVRTKYKSDKNPFPENHRYRDVQKIQKQVVATRDSIKAAQESQDPKELVCEMYEKTQVHFATLSNKIEELSQTLKVIDFNLKYRKKGFLQMRGAICRTTCHHFAFRLSTRGYFGKLAFDHKELTLHILVNPQGGDGEEAENGIRDIKTLSGGEKSYCTVSLVLSLWEDMYPPFRILDEFDVFMDSINRRTAIDLIINYAKDSRKFQYMFLTPLSLDHLKDEKDDVQVVRFDKSNG